MRVLFGILAGLAVLGGLLFLFGGFMGPTGYNLTTASAPQIAQVYSEATYSLAIGVALLVIATLCTVIAARSPTAQAAPRPAGACPRCNAGVQAGQRFCGNCALALDPASIAAWRAGQMTPAQ